MKTEMYLAIIKENKDTMQASKNFSAPSLRWMGRKDWIVLAQQAKILRRCSPDAKGSLKQVVQIALKSN